MWIKDSASQLRRLNRRVLVAFPLCLAGVGLAMFSLAANPQRGMASSDANSSGDSSPNNVTTLENDLNAVTCVSASECWAVGEYTNGATRNRTLIEKWNGTAWSIVASPNQGTSNNFLYGVACTSASECWAVGYYTNGATINQTLIEKWNGTAWSIIASPSHSTLNNYLNAVTCASASECWAVGYYSDSSTVDHTLIEKWNGTTWSIVNSPNHVTFDNFLYGVTCASASDCWAVGYYSHHGTAIGQTLIEKWNGTAWSIVTSPNHGTFLSNYLNAVTCASASECWAVGDYFNGSDTGQTLIEKWNGTAWSIVTSPDHGTSDNFLYDVKCASASDCWAVGEYLPAGVQRTLIEKWNGTAWSIVTSPNRDTSDNFLYGVKCASASECWAVGDYTDSGGYYQTLIEKWNGSGWSIVTSPNHGTSD